MIDRVERVTRTKQAYLNPDRSYDRGRDYDREGSGKPFASVLRKEMEEQESPKKETAFQLTLARPTQSLFYTGQATLSEDTVQRNFDAKG